MMAIPFCLCNQRFLDFAWNPMTKNGWRKLLWMFDSIAVNQNAKMPTTFFLFMLSKSRPSIRLYI
jgi:hypothetical protein